MNSTTQAQDQQRVKDSAYYDGHDVYEDAAAGSHATSSWAGSSEITHADIIAAALWGSNPSHGDSHRSDSQATDKPTAVKVQDQSGWTLDTTRTESDEELPPPFHGSLP